MVNCGVCFIVSVTQSLLIWYRQIIIITHNANLVVNADAEQIVIASNENEVLSYQSGAFEKQDVIDGVCRILEGGRTAFRKRKEKYNVLE